MESPLFIIESVLLHLDHCKVSFDLLESEVSNLRALLASSAPVLLVLCLALICT